MKNLLWIILAQACIEATAVIAYINGMDLNSAILVMAIFSAGLALSYPSGRLLGIQLDDVKKLWRSSKSMFVVCLLQIAIVAMCFIPFDSLILAGYAAVLFGIPILSMAIVGYCMVTSVKSRA